MMHIRKIRPNKAEGPSEIHARLFRDCEREITLPLAMIFSKSLAKSQVPLDWKVQMLCLFTTSKTPFGR